MTHTELKDLKRRMWAGNTHGLILWASHQKVESSNPRTVDFLILRCLEVSPLFALDKRISQRSEVNTVYVSPKQPRLIFTLIILFFFKIL